MKSKKPSKQRKKLYESSLHEKRGLLKAHLSKGLKKELNQRSLAVRSGDTVKIMRGKKKKKSGKVTKVDYKKGVIFIEKMVRKKADGTEILVPFKASNLMITDLELKDDKRFKRKKIKLKAKEEAEGKGKSKEKSEEKRENTAFEKSSGAKEENEEKKAEEKKKPENKTEEKTGKEKKEES
ncbi:MAG: 50S ribosomal protein L24 [archaeon]